MITDKAMGKDIRIGCEIIIQKENQILLGKRKNCVGEGSWGLPGGHLEPNEKLIEGAKRELKEELNIESDDLKFVAITDDIGEDWHYIHVTFSLEQFLGEYSLNEPDKCFEWRFFDLHHLPHPLFLPHLKIIETFLHQKSYLP